MGILEFICAFGKYSVIFFPPNTDIESYCMFPKIKVSIILKLYFKLVT